MNDDTQADPRPGPGDGALHGPRQSPRQDRHQHPAQAPQQPTPHDEAQHVHARYARRAGAARYSLLDPAALRERQGRQRALAQMLVRHGRHDVAALRLIEVGCGTGNNLLELLQMGFAPQHLQGVELLPDRHATARRVLPAEVRVLLGDASGADVQAAIAPASQDLLLVATVFSSLLDDAFQARLAQAMWRMLKPGGAVIWYDFTVNNPRNADVRGVPLQRVHALFPQAGIDARRITLAPPLARALCRIHPALCAPLELLPPLRTHLLAWIAKPA